MKAISLASIGLLVLGSLGSCSSSQTSTNGMTYTRTSTGADIMVSLDDYKIHMPTSFPSGTETFHIKNNGDMPHSLSIHGNGVSQELPAHLSKGESATMTVSLAPGTYDIICPMLGHAELGMRLDVNVVQR